MITPKDLEELKYTAPTHVAVQPLTEASRSFLTGQRAIPEAVLATFKVASASDGRMILPLQRADGEVVGIKYRHETGGKLNVLSAGRSETITEDFEPKGLEILFGTHLCNPEKNSTLHPFCHEFDSMAGAAAGLVNCAAIPNTQTDKFEFIRNQYDWLRKFKKIVIAPPILKDAEKKTNLKSSLIYFDVGLMPDASSKFKPLHTASAYPSTDYLLKTAQKPSSAQYPKRYTMRIRISNICLTERATNRKTASPLAGH